MFNETIGWIGNILFAVCGIPQVVKTFRTKHVYDLSALFLWLWLTFYYIINSDLAANQFHIPLYFNYIANICMVCYLLYAKYVYPGKFGETKA